MPQMMPSMWTMMFIFMIFYSFFTILMTYFLFLPFPLTILISSAPTFPSKWYWKW